MTVSIVVPSAGIYRHNEKLFAGIAAVCAADPLVDVVVPFAGTFSPRLAARLGSLGIPYKAVPIPLNAGLVGAFVHYGIHNAGGETVVFCHDDIEVDVAALVAEARKHAGKLAVPFVRGSHNSDQSGETSPRKGTTTRPIDRAVFSLPRAKYIEWKIDTGKYAVEGYQTSIQHHFAKRGERVHLMSTIVHHLGSSTIVNLPEVEAAEKFGGDMAALSGEIGTTCELGQRPLLPRILPSPMLEGPFELPDDPVEALAIVNHVAAWSFRYKGASWPRVTCGHEFTIPPLLETYDVGLVEWMGYGDTLMHSSAPYHFKALYPWVKFRVFAPAHVAAVASGSTCWDEIVTIAAGSELPRSVSIWNVSNGAEGTPDWGFRMLGISRMVEPRSRRMAPYLVEPQDDEEEIPENAIGLQVHGGWAHKRYLRMAEVADLLRGRGFEPLYFGQIEDGIPTNARHVKTPSWMHFGRALQKLEGWVGFDSGSSYFANALGIPAVLVFASHHPDGLIGSCGAGAPYRAKWAGNPAGCAWAHRATCRYGLGGAVYGNGICGRRGHGGKGADCIDEMHPAEWVSLLLEAMSERRTTIRTS